MSKRVRYGFSDLVVDDKTKVQSYVTVLDTDGKELGDIECYYIEEEE